MKNYGAIIVDDERNVRDALGALISSYCPDIQILGFASSADEARKILSVKKTDIVFLDISMPREDGFSLLQSIDHTSYAIIFVTAFEEYALRALKANAVDYLLKPVNHLELQEAVSKAIYFLELRKNKSEMQDVYKQSIDTLIELMQSEKKHIQKLTISEQFGFTVVNVEDIMYLQADSNYTIIHISGLKKIVVSRTLGEFEKMLDHSMFFRIHKSTILNIMYLKGYCSYQGNYVELNDGTRLSISRRKVNEFREAVRRVAKPVQ